MNSPAEAEILAITLTVNGQHYQLEVPAHRRLVDLLRDTLGLTGTKVGCESGQCGACLVLIDGQSVKSCALLAVQADGAQITTIEGLAQGGQLNVLQEAFSAAHALQCGFCTPGMVIAMTDLLAREPHPDEYTIRLWLDGTFCRCGCYQNAVRAVQQVVSEQAAVEETR